MANETFKIKNDSFWSNLFKTPALRSELEGILLSIPVFKDFTFKELDGLINIIHHREYSSNEYIFFQGDPGIGIYIILEGEVVIEKDMEKGEKFHVARFSKGDFFGELALLDGEKRSASAISITTSKLAVIFKPDLDEYVEKHPKKGIKILRGLSHIVSTRLRDLNADYYKLYNKIKKETEA